MPKFYVGLDLQTRYNYSPVGDPINGFFTYDGQQERRIWRAEFTEDISRLAELVNEAAQCIRKRNFVDLPMKVFKIDDDPKRVKLKAKHADEDEQRHTVHEMKAT